MAAIDFPGFVAGTKDHAEDHGFHIHDERHLIETYSLHQTWEVFLHPEEACGEPVDLYMSLELDARVLLAFEDLIEATDGEPSGPKGDYIVPVRFRWLVPPLSKVPDLLVLATELAAVGGIHLPLEVAVIESFGAVSDAPERRLEITARHDISLLDIYGGESLPCQVFERAGEVSRFLLEHRWEWA